MAPTVLDLLVPPTQTRHNRSHHGLTRCYPPSHKARWTRERTDRRQEATRYPCRGRMRSLLRSAAQLAQDSLAITRLGRGPRLVTCSRRNPCSSGSGEAGLLCLPALIGAVALVRFFRRWWRANFSFVRARDLIQGR